jgi:hypothetical protein
MTADLFVRSAFVFGSSQVAHLSIAGEHSPVVKSGVCVGTDGEAN